MAQQAVLLHQPAAPFCGSCSMPCIHVRLLFWDIDLQHRKRTAEGVFPGGYVVRWAPGTALLFGDPGRGETVRCSVLLQCMDTLLGASAARFAQCLRVQVDDYRKSIPIPVN